MFRRHDDDLKIEASREPLTALREDLGGDLVRVVPARQADQRLAVAVAELPHVAERMARPADRQQHQGHVGAGDGRLEASDRLVLLGLDPDQVLQPQGGPQHPLGLRSTDAADQHHTPPREQPGGFPHLGRRLRGRRRSRAGHAGGQVAVDLPQDEPEAGGQSLHGGQVVDERQQEVTDMTIAGRHAAADHLLHRRDDGPPGILGPSALAQLQDMGSEAIEEYLLSLRLAPRPRTGPRCGRAAPAMPRGRPGRRPA